MDVKSSKANLFVQASSTEAKATEVKKAVSITAVVGYLFMIT